MTYETLDSVNLSEGFHVLFIWINDTSYGIFTGLLLLTTFLIFALGSYYASNRVTGRGDFMVSFLVASFVTLGASGIMMLVPGLIPLYQPVMALAVFIIAMIVVVVLPKREQI